MTIVGDPNNVEALADFKISERNIFVAVNSLLDSGNYSGKIYMLDSYEGSITTSTKYFKVFNESSEEIKLTHKVIEIEPSHQVI